MTALAGSDVPTADRLLGLVESMKGPRVGMVVDVVADRFLFGLPKRISREAPVLILSQETDEWVPGGGANAVANVAALGGDPVLIGVTGRDESGDRLVDLLEQRGVGVDGLLRLDAYRTPTKTRVMAGPRHGVKQQVVRYDVEDRVHLSATERGALRDALVETIANVDALVLSDYGYGLLDDDLIALAKRAACPVLADSRYRLQAFAGVTGATPNEEEAEALYGAPFGDGAELARAGTELRRRLDVDFLLITRGSAGMALFQKDAAIHLPVHGSDQVADVTGAGDTVIGTFSLALAAGASPCEAACLATYTAGIVVKKHGTATTDPAELTRAIEHEPELPGRLREIR